MKKIVLIFILITTLSGNCFSQKAKIYTERGNIALKNGNIDAAKEAYLNALEFDPNYKEAIFNLGNAYQTEAREILKSAQGQKDQQALKKIAEQVKKASEAAAAQYQKAAESIERPEQINKVQYNLGNAELFSGNIQKSIEAYKEALRKVPTDDAARYNLAYAKHLKKQQQQKKQKKQKDDQQKKNQKKEDKQDQKQNQKKDQKQDQKKDQQKEKEQQQKNELSKQEAKQMLQALNKQEKEIQEKLKKKKAKAHPIKVEKDW